MKNFSCLLKSLLFGVLLQSNAYAQTEFKISGHFDSKVSKYEKIGRGECSIQDTTLKTKDAYAAFGDNSWTNYEVRFSVSVPQSESEAQICVGFRAANRDDRYILMLRGGVQKNLYLARLGYMGTDDFLALRELDFQPVTGKWYNFKIQVVGNRIRVFLNNEDLPRIDVTDRYSKYAPTGKITLGGSWTENDFINFSVQPLDSTSLKNVPVKEFAMPTVDKEKLREQQRAAYKPITISPVSATRTEISLNGNWLFAPGYEVNDEDNATGISANDQNWHVMHVPDFWNPSRVWLHGERYNTASKGESDNYYQKETDRCEAYTFDYKKTSVGWYRQWITLPDNIKGKNLELAFDAVSKVGEVWINGRKAGSHIGMFGDFSIDATPFLKPGKNLIAVKVMRDYVKDIKNADKIAGVAVTVEVTEKMVKDLAHGFFGGDPAGIWQPVKLIVTNPLKIEDVFIKPDLTGAAFEITIKNNSARDQKFSVSTAINGYEVNDKLYHNTSLANLVLKAGEGKTFSWKVSDLKPRLWSPEHPNLYNFSFALLSNNGKKEIDEKTIRSGFKTFKSVGDYLYLNGKRYWLRGGNQTAMPLAPNDTALADKFCKIMKEGNIMVTRTHTVPYTEIWMDASDANGIGVSYEGTWPWLFLQSSMPDEKLIGLWRVEFLDLLKKYRNHPSILFWTVNNEMKFYDNDPDFERAKVKMKIISDVVKAMRNVDPTRPVVFDSNYKRNTKKFGVDYFKDIDDGDIDDVHAYYNWYDYSMFQFFKGEWQQKNKNPGRPLISQEMSTGYTDETGHPARFYDYVHQNPESLIGKYAYEYNNPYYFLTAQSFITKELAEALRRSDDKAAGVLHFSAVTWFKNAYLAKSIQPFPVYYDMKKALQPVLVSAELWGRHFYAGQPLSTRICIINDKEDGNILASSQLDWQIIADDGNVISKGKLDIPAVEHYTRYWVDPKIMVPQTLPKSKVNGKLVLKLTENGKVVSANDYDLIFADNNSLGINRIAEKKIIVVDLNKSISPALDNLKIGYTPAASISAAIKQKADVYVLSGLDSVNTPTNEIAALRTLIINGGKVLLTNSGNFGHLLYPEYVKGIIKSNGEVVTMDISESDIFDGLEPLDTRNFNNNERELPAVTSGAYRINRSPNVEALASFTKIHGYLSGRIEERTGRLDKIKGFPIVKIKDKGSLILSEMLLDKAKTDPIAGRLLVNYLNDLCN
ncbi:MAG TPA: glycoside hydrolase family 2 TIM barrel-domain containing protein [Mucilaginibacter sp.]|jgi:hypothetical protein